MANRHTTQPVRPADSLNKTVSTQPKYRLTSDDVIAALANATENRRARQVGEWERLRQQSVRSSGVGPVYYR